MNWRLVGIFFGLACMMEYVLVWKDYYRPVGAHLKVWERTNAKEAWQPVFEFHVPDYTQVLSSDVTQLVHGNVIIAITKGQCAMHVLILDDAQDNFWYWEQFRSRPYATLRAISNAALRTSGFLLYPLSLLNPFLVRTLLEAQKDIQLAFIDLVVK